MKAAWFETFGPARDVLVVGDKPKPEPGPGEGLVHLHTSGVIEAVGAGVDSRRVGERVWVYQAQFGRRFGTAARAASATTRSSGRVKPAPK